jgi:hypothetical protein
MMVTRSCWNDPYSRLILDSLLWLLLLLLLLLFLLLWDELVLGNARGISIVLKKLVVATPSDQRTDARVLAGVPVLSK